MLPMIRGHAFFTADVPRREQLFQDALKEEMTPIPDPPVSVISKHLPPVSIRREANPNWRVDVREAVREGRAIEFGGDPDIAYRIAQEAYLFHLEQASRATMTIEQLGERLGP